MADLSRPTLVCAAGARTAEALLLDEVAAAVEARDGALHRAIAAGDASTAARLLAEPLRIVVSSRSLREHVIAQLARRFGRAVAAVSVQTHFALALEVVERAGEAAPRGDALLGVFVRRFAREEDALREVLGALRDGYGVVEAVARDLVDASFEPAHAEALDDRLGDLPASAAIARARAALRVTARTLDALTAHELAPRAALLRRARELVTARDRELLPARALWIHGFADATGVVIDWLAALLERCGGRAIVDEPPDPLRSGERERAFAAPFVERLRSAAAVEERAPLPLPRPTRIRAGGATAELREVAARIRALLDGGVAPESIAIVARDLAPHRAAIASQLARLAIPYSSHGLDAAPDAGARRLAAWSRLLEDGARTPTDVWLAASADPEAAQPDLRVGLHVLGLGRLADFGDADPAALLGGDAYVRLPVPRGARDDDPPGEDDAPPSRRGLRRRVLSRERVVAVHERATSLLTALAEWPERGAFAAHRARIESILEKQLGWARGVETSPFAPLFAALDRLADEVPAAFELTRDEVARLVARAVEAAARRPAGGAGAGVAVLGAMQARGRTFAHLFVVGLVRDAFPIKPPIDPLLADPLRAALRELLPDLPIKSRSRAEERHLFAELLSAAEHVTLAWSTVTEEGRECAPSAFVERIELDDAPAPAAPLRRGHEAALHAALVEPRAVLAPLRGLALAEVQARLGIRGDADALARTQLAVLDELDPDLSTPAGRARLSAHSVFGGWTARARGGASPLHVTSLERTARCPWQAFLRSELGLEPPPDALDALPALDALLLGQVAHDVLERIVADAGAPTRTSIAEALARGARRVPWPDRSRLRALCEEIAGATARSAGIRSAAFVRALARAVEPALEVARETDWQEPEGLLVLGAELEGELTLAGEAAPPRRVAFRADRVDWTPQRLRVTDYKTGKVPSDKKRADTRDRKFATDVEQGRALQAVAYLRAVIDRGEPAVEGRFLYLRPDAEPAFRERIATRADAALVQAFEQVANVVMDARDAGVFPARLEEPDGSAPRICAWCEVAAACHAGESSARRRYRAWTERAAAALPERLAPDERAALRVLSLGRES